MSRLGMAKLHPRPSGRRPVVEILEGRSLPAIGFISGFGVGVTGQYSTIHSDAWRPTRRATPISPARSGAPSR